MTFIVENIDVAELAANRLILPLVGRELILFKIEVVLLKHVLRLGRVNDLGFNGRHILLDLSGNFLVRLGLFNRGGNLNNEVLL